MQCTLYTLHQENASLIEIDNARCSLSQWWLGSGSVQAMGVANCTDTRIRGRAEFIEEDDELSYTYLDSRNRKS